jgi:hypothetical protein
MFSARPFEFGRRGARFGFGIKKKRAAQGRRSGNHCGRHKKNLKGFQGTPRLELAEAMYFRFLFAYKDSALSRVACQEALSFQVEE